VSFGKLPQVLRAVCIQCGRARKTAKNNSKIKTEIFRALVGADVSVEDAKKFADRIVQGLGRGSSEVPEDVFCQALEESLGGNFDRPKIGRRVMVVGLNGAGKTTTSCKLAKRLRDKGIKACVAPCDLSRPGAVEQVFSICDKADIPVIPPDGATALEVITKARLVASDYDAVIFDIAGRQEAETGLISELRELWATTRPDTVLYVADGAGGQQMAMAGKIFSEAVPIDGIVLTKLDGDAFGGGSISLVQGTGAPVIFTGNGEKLENLEEFNPRRMAKRIMGQADLGALVESLEAAGWEDETIATSLSLEDFLWQMRAIRKVGSVERLAEMAGWKTEGRAAQENETFSRMEAIVLSMSGEERARPEILHQSGRIERVSRGAGVQDADVKEFLGRFFHMKKLVEGG
jgi:signal recognition particle subunit SRP54